MTESDPKGQGSKPGDVADELRDLGRNLADILRSAWESDERRRLQDEIRSGLSDLGTTLNEAATDLKESPTGQRIKEDVKEFRERVRSGEVETKIRDEIFSVLRMVNSELEKAKGKPKDNDESSREA
jgi:hypothetical protein